MDVKVRVPAWATHVVSDHTDMDRSPHPVDARSVKSFTVRLPDDAYFEYGFVDERGHVRADPDRDRPEDRADNPWYPDLSCIRGPAYVPHPSTVTSPATPRGQVERLRLGTSRGQSKGDDRRAVVYHPPGVSGPAPLLLVADGTAYQRIAHLPARIDRLLDARAIRPVRIAFFDPSRPDVRRREYGVGSADVASWRSRWLPALLDATDVAGGLYALGASLGASHLLELAWSDPGTWRGLALQSGAFLGTPDDPDPYASTRSWAVERAANDDRSLPWRTYLEVGSFDWLRDVDERVAALLAERLDEGDAAMRFEERSAGHNWTFWRDGLDGALMHLLGTPDGG